MAAMLGKRSRPRKGEEKPAMAGLNTAAIPGLTSSRLDRDGFDELAAKVRSKQVTAHAAAIEAGYCRKPGPIRRSTLPSGIAAARLGVW